MLIKSDIKFYKGAYIKFSSDTGISNQDGELGNNDFGVYESYNRSSYKRSYSHTYDDDDIESDEDRYESSSYEPKRTKTLGELLFSIYLYINININININIIYYIFYEMIINKYFLLLLL